VLIILNIPLNIKKIANKQNNTPIKV